MPPVPDVSVTASSAMTSTSSPLVTVVEPSDAIDTFASALGAYAEMSGQVDVTVVLPVLVIDTSPPADTVASVATVTSSVDPFVNVAAPVLDTSSVDPLVNVAASMLDTSSVDPLITVAAPTLDTSSVDPLITVVAAALVLLTDASLVTDTSKTASTSTPGSPARTSRPPVPEVSDRLTGPRKNRFVCPLVDGGTYKVVHLTLRRLLSVACIKGRFQRIFVACFAVGAPADHAHASHGLFERADLLRFECVQKPES
ncbi:hypothetical protein PPROV_000782700 [Pycnococcus provasolii]|uniref:Uncharacterized protein n=1 Tax=Pycnococcus provasolii TaxID=41880 RepID=A0A830HTN2_9CHLO|nr:hypothetical protein PPROV_000782700 [Pycnococcus provasolii]